MKNLESQIKLIIVCNTLWSCIWSRDDRKINFKMVEIQLYNYAQISHIRWVSKIIQQNQCPVY